MHTKNLGIHRMVLNFSFLPLQALERSIVYKLYLKYSPLLQLGSHLKALGRAYTTLRPSFPVLSEQGGEEGKNSHQE